MSQGQINGLDLRAARINGQIVREIAMKDSSGKVSRWRPDVVEYPVDLHPVFTTDFNNRPNGNLADGVDFLHHNLSPNYQQVIDGEVTGPSSTYGMDVINHRFSSFSQYFKAKISSSQSPDPGRNVRLQLGGGSKTEPSGPTYEFASPRFFMENGETFVGLDYFRQGWGNLSGYIPPRLTQANEWRAGDEIMVCRQGRNLYVFYNGTYLFAFQMTDETWMAGYFASLIVDQGLKVTELEIGHYSFQNWVMLGDGFDYPDLSKLWNISSVTSRVVGSEVQVDPQPLTTNSTYYSWAYSKHKINSEDQIIRGLVKAPLGQTVSNTIGFSLIGRSGVNGPSDTTPQVGFLATMTNGVQIMTILNGVTTQRTVETPSSVGPLTLPLEMELQCIGNRYFGLINGSLVVSWHDSTNVVPISKERSHYGWSVSLTKSGSAIACSPSLDNVQGLEFDDRVSYPLDVFDIHPKVLPLAGGVVNFVGTGFPPFPTVKVGGTNAPLVGSPLSENVKQATFPAKAAGVYDILFDSGSGTQSLLAAIQYAAQIVAGHYDPTTVEPPYNTSEFIKVFMNPENATLQYPTVDGLIQVRKKALYRMRVVHSLANILYRMKVGSALTDSYVNSADIDFTLDVNGTIEAQFTRTTFSSRIVDSSTVDFELILVSETLLPNAIRKLGTQNLSVKDTFYKVSPMGPMPEFAASSVATNNEVLIPATKQYRVEYATSYPSNNAANSARVVKQNGTVLNTKTDPSVPGSFTVSLVQGDSLSLEASTTSTSTSSRRTLNEVGTFLKVTPLS